MNPETIAKLKKLIAKSGLPEVIQKLIALFPDRQDVILFSQQLEDIEGKELSNTASNGSISRSRSRLAKSILRFLDKITPKEEELNSTPTPQVSETRPVITSEEPPNSVDMKAYDFYFTIRDRLVKFTSASKNWRLGVYRDDQNRAEAIGEISLQLLKLKNHLELNHLEDTLMFELSTLGIELLESAENELLSLVTGKKTSSTGLKLKLNNIQKKLIELVLEIDKKLHIDQASKG
jgi:hypothetical protein